MLLHPESDDTADAANETLRGLRPVVALIEDEADLVAMLRAYLERDGFAVVDAPDTRGGQDVLRRERVDLVVLDLGLPDGNGLDLLRGLRRVGELPVIIVSGSGAETDRVVGLEVGADDYIVKPFSQRELAARIRAVLRRTATRNAPAKSAVMNLGELTIDTGARQVRSVEGPIELTPREYQLLEFLAAAPGQTFSPQQLLEHVWDAGGWQVPSTVAEHVYRVRRKLHAAGVQGPRITTVRSFGYRLDA